jgi:hypothetical protein
MRVSELKKAINLPTLKFVLFSIITAGIYPILWIAKYSNMIKETFEIEDNNFPKNYDFYLAISVGLGLYLKSLVIYDMGFMRLGMFCSLISWILYIIWSFKIQKAILKYTKEKMNIEYKMHSTNTFFLTIYYINYCINELGKKIDEEKN